MRNSLFAIIPVVLALIFGAIQVQGDDEVVFGSEINVSSDTTNSRLTSADSRQILVSGDTIYVVWQGGGDIWFRLSRNEGATWDPPLTDPGYNLSADISTSGDNPSQFPQIAFSGEGYVHVVWREYQGAGNEIFYKRIYDSGTSLAFDPLVDDGGINLSNRPLGSNAARIATSGDNVYVAWQDEFDAKNASTGPLPDSCLMRFCSRPIKTMVRVS